MEIVAEQYENDELPPGKKAPSMADYVAGATFSFPRHLKETTIYRVEELETLESLEPGMFELFLPEKTRFFDHRVNRSMIVGLTPEEVDALISQQFPPLPVPSDQKSSSSRLYLLLVTNVIAAAVLVLVAIVSRRFLGRSPRIE